MAGRLQCTAVTARYHHHLRPDDRHGGNRSYVDALADADTVFKAIEEPKLHVFKNYNTGSELVNLFSTGKILISIVQDFTLAQIHAAVPNAA